MSEARTYRRSHPSPLPSPWGERRAKSPCHVQRATPSDRPPRVAVAWLPQRARNDRAASVGVPAHSCAACARSSDNVRHLASEARVTTRYLKHDSFGVFGSIMGRAGSRRFYVHLMPYRVCTMIGSWRRMRWEIQKGHPKGFVKLNMGRHGSAMAD